MKHTTPTVVICSELIEQVRERIPELYHSLSGNCNL